MLGRTLIVGVGGETRWYFAEGAFASYREALNAGSNPARSSKEGRPERVIT